MYEKGQGVPQDYKVALSYYSRAAEQGLAAAKENLQKLQVTMSKNQKGREQAQKPRVVSKGYDIGPPQQKFLKNLIDATKSSISENDNSAKQKRAWIKASRKLCSSQEFDATGSKLDWVGYVDSIYMSDDGIVKVKVDINDHGNEVRDFNLNEKLIDRALELKEGDIFNKGDFIRFSGRFKKGDMGENECLDAGLDSNPELIGENFTFKFTKIEKIQ